MAGVERFELPTRGFGIPHNHIEKQPVINFKNLTSAYMLLYMVYMNLNYIQKKDLDKI